MILGSPWQGAEVIGDLKMFFCWDMNCACLLRLYSFQTLITWSHFAFSEVIRVFLLGQRDTVFYLFNFGREVAIFPLQLLLSLSVSSSSSECSYLGLLIWSCLYSCTSFCILHSHEHLLRGPRVSPAEGCHQEEAVHTWLWGGAGESGLGQGQSQEKTWKGHLEISAKLLYYNSKPLIEKY